MKALVFIGALDNSSDSTSMSIVNYLTKKLNEAGVGVTLYKIDESDVPLLKLPIPEVPESVKNMADAFLSHELHFWLAPLYHGSIPGVMKNCLDWLEITANQPVPYLLDKRIGLISWADGTQALNGITTMDKIAKSLRAWPLPYSVSIEKDRLKAPAPSNEISPFYTRKLDQLVNIALSKRIQTI